MKAILLFLLTFLSSLYLCESYKFAVPDSQLLSRYRELAKCKELVFEEYDGKAYSCLLGGVRE